MNFMWGTVACCVSDEDTFGIGAFIKQNMQQMIMSGVQGEINYLLNIFVGIKVLKENGWWGVCVFQQSSVSIQCEQ